MQRVSADEAVKFIRSSDTIVVGGSGGGHAVPEALMAALERRFLSEGLPRNITAVHPVGLGDGAIKGANHFAHEGLLKRIVCGTFVNSPKISDMAIANKIEGYTLPQGALSQLMREIAAGRPGLLTKTGLHTFIDPRQDGARLNAAAKEDIIELVKLRGEDYLLYHAFPIHCALIRATSADSDGNLSMEDEALTQDVLALIRRDAGRHRIEVVNVVQQNHLTAPGRFGDSSSLAVVKIECRPW